MAIKTKELLKVANELNKDIPNSWETILVKDFAEILNGDAFKSEFFNKTKGIRIVRIRDLTRNRSSTFYDGEYDKKYLINSGDFLVGMDGDFIGVRWMNGQALLNQRVCKVSTNDEVIHPEFFRLGINRYLQKIHSVTSSVTVTHLSSDTLHHIEFPLPPLNEQKRIVSKIEELFSLIDSNIEYLSKVIHQSSNYRLSLLKTSFEIDAPKKLLSECGEIGTGGTPSRKRLEYFKGDIPWVKTTEVKNEYIFETKEKITQLGLDNSNAKIYLKNAVILAMYGEGKTRGRCAILGISASTNQACAVIVCDQEKLYFKYCYYWLQSQYDQVRAKSSGGNQPNLNLGIVKKLKIVLPEVSRQKEIVNQIELGISELDNFIQNIQNSLSDSLKLKNSVLALAFEGKLVPQDPNDEPASVLLEKIKKEKEQLIQQNPRRKKKNVK